MLCMLHKSIMLSKNINKRTVFKILLSLSSIIIFTMANQVFAANDDLLAGTTAQALATMNGTGRYWAYIIDGAISLAAFAKTKNPFF